MKLRLQDGNRVCIVGGGPAGSLAALHLLALSREHDKSFEVLIFEPRDFTRPGPAGCNRCAGILSSRLQRGLETLGLSLPEEVIQSEIRSYALQLGNEVLHVEQPDPSRRLLSVFRGGGPRMLQSQRADSSKRPASFDDYLLSQACERGARLVPQRVRKVVYEDRPVVHTAHQEYDAELVVLATGVNSRSPLDPGFGYRPPRTEIMAQDEIKFPPGWPQQEVSIYFSQPHGLVFGALTPKGDYLNVSLLGEGMTVNAIPDFFEVQGLTEHFPSPPESLCGCNPRISVSRSKRYFGDRWVAVGDAAVTRLYKDGLGSAFLTSQAALNTAVLRGISRRDFQRSYAPVCRRIDNDNRYGRLLFRLWGLVLQTPPVLKAWISIASTKTSNESDSITARILWGMFTGDEAYRDLLRLSISLRALTKLWRWLRKTS